MEHVVVHPSCTCGVIATAITRVGGYVYAAWCGPCGRAWQFTTHELQPALTYEQIGLNASTRSTCPRALAGRRCRARAGKVCICHHRVLDHLQAWTDEFGPVVTAEPYGMYSDDLAEVLTELHELGLEARIDARSPWFPGSTVMLIIKKADA